MTPSAARGVLDAVLWKPAMRWRVERISVLAPIQFTSFRRNEVESKAAMPARSIVEDGGDYAAMFVDERRQQRNTVALRCVDYIIEARIELTERSADGDNLAKFVDMFRRRVERGQHFHQPYLGCREMVAAVEAVDESAPEPIEETRDLGLMLWDIEFSQEPSGKPRNRPVFFAARLDRGVMEVPRDAATAESTISAAVRAGIEGGGG
jgi:CRISPR-associated protein Cas5d